MPADERIKIIFHRVHVYNDADTFCSGEWYFRASVGGEPVNIPRRTYKAVEGRTIPLGFDHIIDVRDRTTLRVLFEAFDEDATSDDVLGSVEATLGSRYAQQAPLRQEGSFVHHTRYFALDWEVRLAVGGVFSSAHPDHAVFACRENPASVSYTTVSGRQFRCRGEVHPVVPVPRPPPATQIPARPRTPPLPGIAWQNPLTANVVAIAPNSPMNVIPNPAVIPWLDAPTAAVAALPAPQQDYSNVANARNCARIELTWYQPATLNFQPGDRRLEWSAVPANVIAFLGPARGTGVQVYGRVEGPVELQLRFQGALLSRYRAIVRRPQRITCRFSILNGPTRRPRSGPADIRNHMEIANRFLYQMGIYLFLDPNPQLLHQANAGTNNRNQPTGIPGIFRIACTNPQTWNVPDTGIPWACRRNRRGNILNFAYVHSIRDNPSGMAYSWPASNWPAVMDDSGSPSTSWVRPSGIAPDGAAARVTMNLIVGTDGTAPGLRSMLVTNACGHPVNDQVDYGRVIAHELGHMLNLGHRVEGRVVGANTVDMQLNTPANQLVSNGAWWDNLQAGGTRRLHPFGENVMRWQYNARCQDFDLIQAEAINWSPLVPTEP